MTTWNAVAVRGVGLVLPGIDKPCQSLDEYTTTVMSGGCRITPLDTPRTPVRIAGQVPGSGADDLNLPDRTLARMARGTRMAHAAVADALDRAGVSAAEISRRDAVLIVTSLQFSTSEVLELADRYRDAGVSGMGVDYWAKATPGSTASALCLNLGLDVPTLTMAGGCAVSLRAVQLAASMIAHGEVEYAVVVGFEHPLDPLFLSSTSYQGRSGHRASSTSDNPLDVRPHDAVQTGNAPAEGAVAVVLGAPGATSRDAFAEIELLALSTRNGGPNAMGLGDAAPCGRDLARLLRSAGLSLGDLAFLNDFAEGNRQLEDFLCETLTSLREEMADDSPLLITSQEACFGHLPGAVGLLKALNTVLMLVEERVAPTANLVTPYPRLPARPVGGSAVKMSGGSRPVGMTASIGGGGDTTAMLVRIA
ncbi:beta-ketoacyl synthase N-terminal-like domain-containing protein [Amycolatopsis sp. NPDC006131]|uniref:beta-ketoacyl synthase N-terminal-like domain-containing protein n=1 Tax=Amycolatopsis sp. NPDC006131 TaxID=3156731 RepID=UPI0033B8D79F